MKHTAPLSLLLMLIGGSIAPLTATPLPARSILEIRHSISDDNIIAPESFETQTRLLEENFYLKNYVVPGIDAGNTDNASDADYEQRLTKLPTVIELPYNSIVRSYIDMYVNKRRGLVADMLALNSYYRRFFEEELLKEGMPVELEYLPVIESAINPNAVSRAGAVGLWQFMPATAQGLGMEINSLVDERRDPRLSSRYAARYLKQLYNIYNDWSLAIAAYNCGPGNVNKALRRASGDNDINPSEAKRDFWDIYNYLPAETRGYVPAFIAANYIMNYYNLHGITPTIIKRHLTTDTVTVDKYVHFNQIASVLNIPVEEIRMLNPQFLKDIIPGDYRPYHLTLPTQQCLSYIMSEKRILEQDKELYARRTTAVPGGTADESPAVTSDGGLANLQAVSRQTLNASENNLLASTANTEQSVKKTHIVQRGENIRNIAKLYGVSATDIKRWNKLRGGKVREGDRLIIEVNERINPDEIKITPAPEVAQATPESTRTQTSETTSETEPVPSQAKAPQTTPAPAQSTPARNVTNTQQTRAAQTAVHVVKKGDTLSSISRKYSTTVAAIQAANGMKPSDTNLAIGRKLKIPSKGASVSGQSKSSGKAATGKPARRKR